MRGRRASVATEKPIVLPSSPGGTMERQRSPRGSMVPNIALDTESDSPDEGVCRRILPDLEQYGTGRNSLVPEANRSSRNSLIPDDYCRSPRGSLIPDSNRSPRNSLVPDVARSPRSSLTPEISLSPRHSLVPDSALSPRNSLVPDVAYNRSPRNSMVAVGRTSLLPENGNANRSPRHSLVPDSTRSPRGSMANLDFDRSPRGSICPEMHRPPRGSITPMEVTDRSPRGSIASECLNQSPRGSIAPDPNRSPRGSIGPDPNRSPRGSICPESNRSPRGSIAPHDSATRGSPRGSIGINDVERHSRGSLGAINDEGNRSPRGSIGTDGIDRSPRSSLGGHQDRRAPRGNLGVQDPRRASADQGSTRNRSSSPYRQRDVSSGSVRSGGSGGAQINLGYGTNTWADSRRASSSVSQLSGDESRRLFAGGAKAPEKGNTEATNLGVATYGSVVFQLKDAHLEANGICDFVFRALRVISKTMTFTVCLTCLTTVPILMFIFGVQFIKDCPKEPFIPVYMLIGGVLGTVRMVWALYSQIRSRRPEVLSVPSTRTYASPMKLLSVALSFFLVVWFILGHYWILHIMWPEYEMTLYSPNRWCHKMLYIFSLVHLCVIYAVLFVILMMAVGLAFCRILECPLPERYRKRQFQSRLIFLKIFKMGE
ncbi:peptidyl-prolyl cis-trans isomerase CYP95-like [Pseudomyrmex gracilis]|uniref:peptidyl-prolyl cis-trans isomerase CYP95-like n=1 Tax=Pseudomyrmex gracilis TaxID=219809 RepID=UPI0009949431|nr:peptidyl-prolyl cis-trans isomerase CYP95-like [Pseudomyrmex gracilis]